jgi:hypothetical protein
MKLIPSFREYIVIQNAVNISRVNSPKRKISFPAFLSIIVCLCFVPSVSGSTACGFLNCATCDGSICTQCDDTFGPNVPKNTCMPCKDTNCKACPNPYNSNVCDICIDNNYLNPSRGCTPCSIPQCLTCVVVGASPQCTSCNPGYGLDSGANCVTCSSMITHCSSCAANATCTTCDTGYALSLTGFNLTC